MTDTITRQWCSAALTHVGHVRQINEDAFLDQPEAGMWAVADGMGGHHAGDVASTSVISALSDVKPSDRLSQCVNDIEDRLMGVNSRLRQMAAEHNDNRTIGSTVIALVAFEKHCALLWAGDSRAYRFRDNSVSQVTRDHSQVEEMVERGLLQPEDAESHPASNVITRAVGAAEVLYVDVDLHELQKDDVFLLCSDGLYKHIQKDEIETLLKSGKSMQECAQYLIDNTLERGATDNVTVVLVKIE
jgi:protein phosphatase